MTRRRTALPPLVLGALSLAGLAAGPTPSTRTPLKVIYGRYLSFAPLAIASAEGFFRGQGIDVELVHLTGSSEATPTLIRGGVDVSAGMIKISDFNAIARGASLRIVADKGHHAPESCASAAVVARAEFLKAKDPESAEHLRGARAASTPLSFKEYVLEVLLGSKGLGLSDLHVVRLQEPSAAEALADGSIDLSHMGEPYLSRVTGSGRVVPWKPVPEILPGAQAAILSYGPSLLEHNRDAGRRFMVAYLQGVRQYNRGKTDRNVAIISRETGLDPPSVRTACWESIRADGKVNIESVLDFQRWAVRRGALDSVVPPERFWDPTFTDEADRALSSWKP